MAEVFGATGYHADRQSHASGEDHQRVVARHYAPVILQIRELWRQRQDWCRASQRMLLQAGAICRRFCDSDKVEGAKLLKRIVKGKAKEADRAAEVSVSPMLSAIEVSLRPHILAVERELVSLAKKLPIAAWCKLVRGVGIEGTTLASLVGECGDAGSYKSFQAVWKRMGLAVISGERQRKKLDAEQAILHGYAPHRRAVAYVLAENLVKGQRDGPYKRFYDVEKARQAIVIGVPKFHAHKRAMRHMAKRFLRDMYRAWRALDRGEDFNPPTYVASPEELALVVEYQERFKGKDKDEEETEDGV